jgi:hypothetical protein
MPEAYDIDPARSLVVCRAWGEFSNRDLHEHYRRLVADPSFDPRYAQLADLREVTEFSVDSEMIESSARKHIFAPGTPRAFVAPKGVAFGLARMFAAYSPDERDVHIFERVADAEAWLALRRQAGKLRK